jgi:L,D-transpeptidase catalytic domain
MSAAHVKSVRAMLFGLLAVCIVPAGTAEAQFLFWPQYRSWWSHHGPVRHKHRHRRTKPPMAKKDEVRDAPNGPLQIVVSIADQRISVYDNGALIARSAVSTGVPRHPTPVGVFSVIGKKRWHRSNLYSGAPMPYMQRLTWSGIALHAGVLPGYPASHGCIRLKKDFAVRLWHLTRRGTRVIIAPDDIGPVEIADPHLSALTPKTASGPPESRAAIADNAIIAAAVHPPLTPDADAQPFIDPPTPGSTSAAVAPRKVVPISVFVSRKSSRLFVRQGFTPLFDAPVTIQDREEPLGTHVFTVMAVPDEGAALRWTAMSMPERSSRTPEAPRGRKPGSQIVETTAVSSPDKASAALARIEIPQDVVERISERLTPGSSFIVSDYGISQETGKGTDFIVLTQ